MNFSSHFDLPGQTLYHDGLLAERDGGGALFFAGDSFTPSGIDNYCLQNRDLVREGEGYLYCLKVLEGLPRDVWLVNQHVEPSFRFTGAQFSRMRAEVLKQMAAVAELAPWPDPNYAIDESWAAADPYGSEVRSGENITLRLRILNHSPKAETYRVNWNVPAGWKAVGAKSTIAIPARGERASSVILTPVGSGLHVLTADVSFGGRQLREWAEALVRVRP